MDYDFKHEKELISEAKIGGNWLYNPGNKDWYSPEEFEERFLLNNGSPNFASRKWVDQIIIRDPRDYLLEFIIWIAPFVNKAAKHGERVKKYYKDNPQYIKT